MRQDKQDKTRRDKTLDKKTHDDYKARQDKSNLVPRVLVDEAEGEIWSGQIRFVHVICCQECDRR